MLSVFYCLSDLRGKSFLKMFAGHPGLFDMTDECIICNLFTVATFLSKAYHQPITAVCF